MRKFGHREGVRRYQRYGQTALDLGRTLDDRHSLHVENREDENEVLAFTATCQECGGYWDIRQHERCPAPCGGYLG